MSSEHIDNDHLESFAITLTAHMTGLNAPLSAQARGVLHGHVCDFVEAMRARGWPPERVILAVKRIGAEAGMTPSRNIAFVEARNLNPTDKLLIDIVGWCIAEYFRRPDVERRIQP